MKKLKTQILLLTFILSNYSFSQIINGIIKDSITNEAMPIANIVFTNGYGGTNTKPDGSFSISVKNYQNDSLKISYLGYKSKYINLKDFNENKTYFLDIKLSQETTKIDEINIKLKALKYQEEKKIIPKKEGNVRLFSIIGQEIAYRFKNEKEEKGRVKSIGIHFRKNRNATKNAVYRLKFYSIDSITKGPLYYLIKKELIIRPKNKTHVYKINLEKEKIPFFENGIFVGVELIDPENSIKKTEKVGPGLRLTYGEIENFTWENYRGKRWHKSDYYDKLNNKNANLYIELNILYKKSEK